MEFRSAFPVAVLAGALLGVAASGGPDKQNAPVSTAMAVGIVREANAAIGGEGNGGVILPERHLGRDAPIGDQVVHFLESTGGCVPERHLDRRSAPAIPCGNPPKPVYETPSYFRFLSDAFCAVYRR